MAGRRGSAHRLWLNGLLLLGLAVGLCAVKTARAEGSTYYEIRLPRESVSSALNELSEQTNVPVVFPFDLAKDRMSNPVVGRFTLQEALDALLQGTGLSGGLSDKGVLTISPARSVATQGEKNVPRAETSDSKPAKSNHELSRIATVLAAVVAAFGASAQDASHGADNGKLEEIIVTAEKRTERLQDVPVPVAVIDAVTLTESNQVLLRDYYSTVPGLNVTPNYVSRENLSLRGIGGGALDNPTVGIVIDEMPFGSSTVHGSSVPDFDPGDLERVEVLRGPQGTLYGANSMGGLLKFVTVDPSTDGVSGRVQAGTSSVYNGAELGYNFRGSVNVPLSDTLAIRASGYEREDPGYIDNILTGREGINEQRAEGGRLSALWKPSGDFSVKLSAMYQHSAWDGLNEVDQGLGDLQQSYVQGAGSGDRRVQAYGALINAKFGGMDFTSVTGYNTNRNRLSLDESPYFNTTFEQAYGVSGALYAAPHDDTSRFTQEFRLASSIGSQFDWLVGAFYSHEYSTFLSYTFAENPTSGPIVAQYYEGISGYIFKEYAGFADLTYHFTDQFDVQLGARESHDQAISPTQITTGLYATQFLEAARTSFRK